MPTSMRRKTVLIFALAFALLVSLGAIITQESMQEKLGQSYYVICLSIIGCILILLAGYTWDRTLVRQIRDIGSTARTKTKEVDETPFDIDSGDSGHDEVMGLARQIERMAQALQKTEASYRAIVEDQLDLICRYRADGKLTFVNGAYQRFFGKKRAELIGQRFMLNELGLPSRDFQGELPESASFEHELSASDGRRVTHVWTHRAIKDSDGRVMEFQAVGHDITVRKEAEAALVRAKDAAESADRAKSEFLAIVSHEIRTPINGVIGFTKLLRETPLNTDQRGFVDMISTSGLTLEALISDILDMSKIEAGKIEIDHAPYALRRAVEEVITFFTPKARAAGLTLHTNIDADVPAVVNGDPNRLRQILVNLVGNAIKFTERGHVTVNVSCGRGGNIDDSSRREIRLFFGVTDTGIGIPADKISQLFRPFSQVDTSASRRRGGTGLGLIISKRLCELMGGAISVESEAGRGSTFRFTILSDYDRSIDSNPPMEPARNNHSLTAHSAVPFPRAAQAT
jgi:PAS domain S-box-containing protein